MTSTSGPRRVGANMGGTEPPAAGPKTPPVPAGETGFAVAPPRPSPPRPATIAGAARFAASASAATGTRVPAAPSGGGASVGLVDEWMKFLGVERSDRFRRMSGAERVALARIAVNNAGTARAIISNRAFESLRMRDVAAGDHLPGVLTILDRLLKSGVTSAFRYISARGLLSNNHAELAGTIWEMAYAAVAAEHAARNGYNTIVQEHRRVPWELMPGGFLEGMKRRLPKIEDAKFARIAQRAEIDAHVIGDRLIEVKLRAAGKVVYSRQDAGDSETFVSEQLQAAKLIAIAKSEGLRGVEFALFAEAADPNWIGWVARTAREAGVGIKVMLHPPADNSIELAQDTISPMVSRGAPLNVVLPALTPPPEKREHDRGEDRWGVEARVVELMLSGIEESAVRSAARPGPRAFYRNVRSMHADQIMEGLKGEIKEYFDELDKAGRKDEEARRRWMQRWAAIMSRLKSSRNMFGRDLITVLADFSGELYTLITGGRDILRMAAEARERFLSDAIPLLGSFNGQMDMTRQELDAARYTAAPHILGRLDAFRESILTERLAGLVRREGIAPENGNDLGDIESLVKSWEDDRSVAGMSRSFTRAAADFRARWRRMADHDIGAAKDRWRSEMRVAQAVAPPTEEFPYDVAREFLGRFRDLSSHSKAGRGRPGDKRRAVPAGDWAEVSSLLGLGGGGEMPALGAEVMSALTLLPDRAVLLPAEVMRIREAVDSIELFHVEEDAGDVYYYLPQVSRKAWRVVTDVILTAMMRRRVGSGLGVGSTFIYPWVISGSVKGEQPHWIEVSPGGSPDELVLERIVVAGGPQLTDAFIEGLLKRGLVIGVPAQDGGEKQVSFSLLRPMSGRVRVEPFDISEDIGVIVDEVIKASFMDRFPGRAFVEGKSRVLPLDEGYLTPAEIEKMGIKDVYSGLHGAGSEKIKLTTIRNWPQFIEQLYDERMRAQVSGMRPLTVYFLRIRTSAGGGKRVLLNLRNIKRDFGELLRLARVPGFQLATEIAKSGQKDAYDVLWTHARLMNLFAEVDAVVPEAQRQRFIRRFRANAGGSTFRSLDPGQAALCLRELRRSEWGAYFRLRRPKGMLTRGELEDMGLSGATINEIAGFIKARIPDDGRTSVCARIRSVGAPFMYIFNLARLRELYADQLPPALLAKMNRVLPREPRWSEAYERMARRAVGAFKRAETLEGHERQADCLAAALGLLRDIVKLTDATGAPLGPLARKLERLHDEMTLAGAPRRWVRADNADWLREVRDLAARRVHAHPTVPTPEAGHLTQVSAGQWRAAYAELVARTVVAARRAGWSGRKDFRERSIALNERVLALEGRVGADLGRLRGRVEKFHALLDIYNVPWTKPTGAPGGGGLAGPRRGPFGGPASRSPDMPAPLWAGHSAFAGAGSMMMPLGATPLPWMPAVGIFR